ncbi:MAG: 2-C-methyl-D-erythritol 2,4-cyclodiphosphate synthase [Candidatus Zixiibacteriota bacterium]|nr:MAG: 2-C-methyl-D-erythritol 2,4-cyclodiphosphate synthase [candidate division Zixibacteria bacterium]
MPDIRIGHGFDVHRLVKDRVLIIGGVVIPFAFGLEGHSDADVLLHAIADALLGAAGLPDIGQQFPPTDERYLDADSALLLTEVREKVRAAGFGEIVNIDAIIMAERPAMNPHVPSMRERIASILDVPPERINIKATTCERLGFVGREEGMAASAVCLLARHE